MTPTDLDRAVAALVRMAASPAADWVAFILTTLASGPATLVILVAAALAVIPRIGRRGAVLLAAWCATAAVVHAAKLLFGRARPSLPYTAVDLSTGAFPSGHAANAVVTFGLLAILAGERWPRSRGPAAVVAALLALGAGLSRVYLGVHWATDVVAGWAVGAAVLALAAAAIRRAPRASPP